MAKKNQKRSTAKRKAKKIEDLAPRRGTNVVKGGSFNFAKMESEYRHGPARL